MASPFGPLVKEQAYISTIPFDVVAQVGQYKQGLYNQAIQKGQEQLDAIGNLDIRKPSDVEYISNKLRSTVDKMNQFAGLDLSKKNIQSQLDNVISESFGDPEFTKRVVANKNYVTEVERVQDLMKNHQEKFASTNYKVFQDQVEKWLNDPDQTSFNASYTPFFDADKLVTEVGKDMLAHPDVHNIVGMSGGVEVTQQIKEVAASRLLEGMKSAVYNNSQALGQYRIDYEATKGTRTSKEALDLLNAKASQQHELVDNLNKILSNSAATQSDKDLAKKQLEQSQTILNSIEEEKNKIESTGDVSGVFSFDNYLDTRLANKANALAFREEGEVKMTDLSKLKYQRDTARLVAEWKAKSDLALADYRSRLKASGNGLNPNSVYNAFYESLAPVYLDGTATMPGDQVKYLFNNAGKLKDDGSFALNLNNSTIRLSKVNASPELADASSDAALYSMAVAGQDAAFEKYLDKIRVKEVTNYFNNKYKGEDNTKRINDYLSTLDGKQVFADPKDRKRKLAEFKNSEEYKKYVDDLKKKNIDLSNNTVNGHPISDDTKKLAEYYSKLLPGLTSISGAIDFVPDNKNNIERDAEGQIWITGQGRVSFRQLVDGLGASEAGASNTRTLGLRDSKAWQSVQDMRDSGVIKKVPGQPSDLKEEDYIYYVPLTIKAELDPLQSNSKFLRENVFTGDKANGEIVPIYMQKLKADMTRLKHISDQLGDPSSDNFARFVAINPGNSATLGVGSTYFKSALESQGIKPNAIRSLTSGTGSEEKGVLDIVWDSDWDPDPQLNKSAKQLITGKIADLVALSKNPAVDFESRLNAMQTLLEYKGVTDKASLEAAMDRVNGVSGAYLDGIPDLSTQLAPHVPKLRNIPQQYSDWINQYSKKYGVPTVIAQALGYAESSYNPNAKSPVGALGLFQLMPKTASSLGVTNRRDPEQNIKAGIRYLRQAYDQLGSWELAVAGYNWGPGKVAKYKNNVAMWPKETKDHVAKVRYYANILQQS